MIKKSFAASILALVSGGLLAVHAFADTHKNSPAGSASRIDPSKIAFVGTAKAGVASSATAKATRPKAAQEYEEIAFAKRSGPKGMVHLSADDWEAVKSKIAAELKLSVASLPSSPVEAKDLVVPGNRITISPWSILPSDTRLDLQGPIIISFVASVGGAVMGQAGTVISMAFPVTPSAAYVVSCSGVPTTDFDFCTSYGNMQHRCVDGHVDTQPNGSIMMAFMVPPDATRSSAGLGLTPTNLPPAGANSTAYQVFAGCDIMRVM